MYNVVKQYIFFNLSSATYMIHHFKKTAFTRSLGQHRSYMLYYNNIINKSR